MLNGLVTTRVLAATARPWHGRAMAEDKSSGRAGGAFIALGLLAGPIAGAFYGQPIIGLLIGFTLGVAIAVAIWLGDRKRSR
jgi:predicted lipid-binding transport protein (Tim44 family)